MLDGVVRIQWKSGRRSCVIGTRRRRAVSRVGRVDRGGRGNMGRVVLTLTFLRPAAAVLGVVLELRHGAVLAVLARVVLSVGDGAAMLWIVECRQMLSFVV